MSSSCRKFRGVPGFWAAVRDLDRDGGGDEHEAKVSLEKLR